jgi:hypothetical protein
MVGEISHQNRFLLDLNEEKNFERIANNIIDFRKTKTWTVTEQEQAIRDNDNKYIEHYKRQISLTENNILMIHREIYVPFDRRTMNPQSPLSSFTINYRLMRLENIVVDMYSAAATNPFIEFINNYRKIIKK